MQKVYFIMRQAIIQIVLKMQNVLHPLKITGVYAREKTRSIEGNCTNFSLLALYRSMYYGGNKSFEKGE